MNIIRQGIAEMRYVPERLPTRLGFTCTMCKCEFTAEREEVSPVSLYGKFGRIVETAYRCRCPWCGENLSAARYFYEEEE